MAARSVKPDLLAIAGGVVALSLAARFALRRRRGAVAPEGGSPCHVVVIGAGFGGLSAALELAGAPEVHLTVIDTQNHHVFQPLLYQVATAALSPEDIASPVRDILPAEARAHVVMETVTGIDTSRRQVLCGDRRVPYDELVIATGSRSSYFGHDDWAEAAPSLKTLDDALELRRRILSSFEQADASTDPAEQARLLTFVLIGAGPTGVEMAGSIAEMGRERLWLDWELRAVRPRVLLVEAGERVLAAFASDLSENAVEALGRLGVEVRTDTRVTAIEKGQVHLGDEIIRAATIVWTAGTAAAPVAEWLGVKPGRGGRVEVGPDLRVAGREQVQAIGDVALALDRKGAPLPALAPVAKQQGSYVAHAILRRLRGQPAPGPFRYRDYGTMATIGRGKAVAQFGPVHLTGVVGWVLWAGAHIFFLIGFRNRFLVSAQWMFAFATNQRPGQLIIGRLPGSAGTGAN